MNYFSLREILYSLLYAIIYGAVSALIFCVFRSARIILYDIRKSVGLLIKYDKIYQVRFTEDPGKSREMHPTELFLSIVFLFVVYILLSYHALDGVIRLYMLITFFASFYLSKIVISAFLDKIVGRIVRLIFSLFIVAFRFATFPACRLLLKLKGKFVKKS